MARANESKEGAIRAQNRNKIIQAAEQEFASNGFKGTTVQKIADISGLPKTNVLYYFKSKDALYMAVLEEILSLWNSTFDKATKDDDPAIILARYISEKMEMSRTNPLSSKIFALEIINGAPNLSAYFKEQHCSWMEGRVNVIQAWMDEGKMASMDPHYLLFHIWACCQHYADFSAQITELKGLSMNQRDFDDATANLIQLILTGCELKVPANY